MLKKKVVVNNLCLDRGCKLVGIEALVFQTHLDGLVLEHHLSLHLPHLFAHVAG